MIIDKTHRSWIAGTVVAALAAGGFYAVVTGRSPDGLTGGSVIGLWYGIIGSALMLFAGLLAVLKRVPAWGWIGRRQTWLRGHIWLGLLSVLFIACHSGPGLGGPLEIALWIVLGMVIASGVFGLILQQFVPRMLAERLPAEASYEQIPHICELLQTKADALVDDITEHATPAGAKLREFHESEVRPFLMGAKPRDSVLADPLRAEAAFQMLRGLPGMTAKEKIIELEDLCAERRRLAVQERYHLLLHGWLLVHVPLSAALLVLGGVHAVMAVYY